MGDPPGRGGGDDAYSGLAWSDDARTLAFVRPGGPRQINQVVLYDVASAKSAVLTSDRYESFDPTFSPDGREIAFHSWRGGSRDLSARSGSR